ncbi:MAG: hypothetical protein L0Y35_07435 [Flammeovirgaceae bacterium]|nr:hypothetical protein [Flammeovirgaceae bacterium]
MIQVKGFVILLAMGVIFSSQAQIIEVKKEKERIKDSNTEGYAVDIETSAEDLTTALNRFLKNYGKTKQTDGLISVAEPIINGATYTTPIYGKVTGKGKNAQAWMGIKKDEWGDDAEDMNKEIEKMVKAFGVSFHRGKIQDQIDESNQALNAVERQQQRLLTQNKELLIKLENNQREKLQLEKAVEANKLEFEILKMRIELNKTSQDSVALAGDKIRKVIEAHKEKQRKVN